MKLLQNEFENSVQRIKEINETLRNNNFNDDQIDLFWSRIFRLQYKMMAHGLGLNDISVCSGCGNIRLNPHQDPARHLCCDKNNYVGFCKNIDPSGGTRGAV